MKKFEEILGYTQEALKSYLSNYLRGTGYKVDSGDGYVFAKGDVPVLLIAHMDTAHKEIPKTILRLPTPDGIKIAADNSLVGGDDRCGCWMIMNIIKRTKCHVLFVEDEEIGCIGARKFAKTPHADYIKENISFMIELDRRGKNDCVFYSNDNKEFKSYIIEKTGTKEALGSCSDISHLMPETNVAGVNISCGYYNEHTKNEYIMESEMNDIMKRVGNFLANEEEFPKFEYVAKKYESFGNWVSKYNQNYQNNYQNNYHQMSFGDYKYASRKEQTLGMKALRGMEEMCLTVTLNDYGVDVYGEVYGEEIEAVGKNPAECWATLFLENEDLSFSMIEDYFFS